MARQISVRVYVLWAHRDKIEPCMPHVLCPNIGPVRSEVVVDKLSFVEKMKTHCDHQKAIEAFEIKKMQIMVERGPR